MKILLVEDDQELARSLKAFLMDAENICEHVTGVMEATSRIDLYDYDILLLDIKLEDGNGIEVLKELKKKNVNTGVIILSAKNEINDRVYGLLTGADDYLPKPFNFTELSARITSLFRRMNFNGSSDLLLNELKINPVKYTVKVNDELLFLTRKEFDLILYLLSNRNRVLSKESIATHVWGDNYDLVDSFDFVYNHIKNLRRKIKEKGGNDYIKTIYGIGYKFELYETPK
ncbi:MAG: response regulator transcription factor [Bacteroidales bacterium]|nr:response regulator transcription factor [Bacteroidales bacterium]